MRRIYKHSRPSVEYPIYERESVDPADPNPVVISADQPGYRVEDITYAREHFAKALNLPGNELPW
jgi:hypothetical protein